MPPNGRQNHSALQEIKHGLGTVVAEAIPLAFSIVVSFLIDWMVRWLGRLAGPSWTSVTHAVILIADATLALTLIVPKALVVVNDIFGLLGTVFETAALGFRKTGHALKTGQRMVDPPSKKKRPRPGRGRK